MKGGSAFVHCLFCKIELEILWNKGTNVTIPASSYFPRICKIKSTVPSTP